MPEYKQARSFSLDLRETFILLKPKNKFPGYGVFINDSLLQTGKMDICQE